MPTANDLIVAMEKRFAADRAVKEAERCHEECVLELKNVASSFAEGLVGKTIIIKNALRQSFWPRRAEQDWWGRLWGQRKSWKDHEWYEESSLHNKDDVQGVVVSWWYEYHRVGVVVEDKHFYFKVLLYQEELENMQVVDKVAA